jgi:polyvinyl alcohol dehydrogenase (cytochrome)
MLTRYVLPVVVVVAAVCSAGQVLAQQNEGELSSASQVSGFEGRCASCHDNVRDGMPSRAALMQLSAERVLEILGTGTHAGFTFGLTDPAKRAMAELTAGKPFAGAPARDAASMPNQCGSPLALSMAGPQWNGWSPDPEQTRFQPAASAGLTAAQIPQLQLKWAFGMPGAGAGSWAQPTVVGRTVFIGSDNRFVYALEAETGCVHWSFEAMGGVRTAVSISELAGVPGVQYGAYFGDYLGNVYGVDAETGEQLWTVRGDEHPGAKITGSPVLDPAGGRLFVPVSSWEEIPAARLTYNCCRFVGSILALDVGTGEQVWKTYTMPERPQAIRKNSLGVQLYAPAGAAVWNTPTLDLERRLIYAGTSNAYIVGSDDGTTDAIVAFEMDTGRRAWWSQMTVNDNNRGGCGTIAEQSRLNCPGFVRGPNDDVSASPILHELPDGRTVLMVPQESGRLTAIDPDNEGVKVWVGQVGDIQAAGSIFGGAYDGELFYRGLSFPDGTGAMGAMRPSDGKRVWYTDLPLPDDCSDRSCRTSQTGGTTVMPGVAFSGARDGILRAYSSRDGQIIWTFPTNRTFDTVNGVPGHGGGFGGPGGPTIVDGMLFTGSGYSILGGEPGNVLLAFGMD